MSFKDAFNWAFWLLMMILVGFWLGRRSVIYRAPAAYRSHAVLRALHAWLGAENVDFVRVAELLKNGPRFGCKLHEPFTPAGIVYADDIEGAIRASLAEFKAKEISNGKI